MTCFRRLSILYETGHVTGTFFSFKKILAFACFRVLGVVLGFGFFFGKLKCKLDLCKKRKTKNDDELPSTTRKS